MQDIFVFDRTGLGKEGKVLGRFRATGIRPKCSQQLESSGFPLPIDMFEHTRGGAASQGGSNVFVIATFAGVLLIVLGLLLGCDRPI